jgi:hypothetical protein
VQTRLPRAVVEANDPCGLADRHLDRVAGASLGPVGLVAEIVVDGIDIDPRSVVVELEPVSDLMTHSVASLVVCPTAVRGRSGGSPRQG